ncbi:MAG: DUF3500 domain-containing protein [Burkholderiaceae bacterium]
MHPLQRMASRFKGGVLLALLLVGGQVFAQASASALRLIQATPEAERGVLQLPFKDELRSDWHYTPRSRDGLAWRAMSPAQRDATIALLRSALTEPGLAKVRALMSLEIVLRELETFGLSRDPDNYAVAIYGQPAARDAAWGWRIEGHHLSLHFSLEGDRHLATLPQFFGANPAQVPRDVTGGPPKGFRLLAAEEDLARSWLESLTPAQLRAAVFGEQPFGDIVTRNAARVKPMAPVGLPLSDMNAAQQATVLKLVAVFAEHLRADLTQARLARVRAGGLDSIRVAWAGATQRGEPFYFRVQGADFLIEFDNSGANHIHSVWRDFDGDWGRDVLAEHYRRAAARGQPHRQP